VPEPSRRPFDDVWDRADAVPGWLTREQARLLWDAAAELGPEPVVVEIGSHQGRSTLVLGEASRSLGGRLVAVDPFVEGRLFGGRSTRSKFEENVAAAGLDGTVELLADYSTRARPHWEGPIDLLYVDGKHDYWTLSDDLRWSRHQPVGAPLLVHDCFSSLGVTLGVLVHVLTSRRLRYEGRVGSLALFRVGRPTAADRWRIVSQLPWWLRNLVVKVLLRLRLRVVARVLFGHRGPYDPY
jgi:hypothetical protein